MIINHNLSAMFSARQNGIVDRATAVDFEKLSSGLRINKAGDDASGLSVSEKMRAQIRGLNQASRNASDGISMIQTAEGFLQETTAVIHRIRELAVQSANGTYTSEDRLQIQVEVSQLVAEIDRIASHAQFNGMNLLTGRFARSVAAPGTTSGTGAATPGNPIYFHIGAYTDQRMPAYIATMTATSLGLKTGSDDLSLSNLDKANTAIGRLDSALRMVNKQRSDLGAYQNRLENAVTGIDNTAENLQAAESRIRDTDVAKQVVEYQRNLILKQSTQAMLAQANQSSMNVLQLLR